MAAAAATAADTSGGSGLQCSLEPVKAASAAYLCCVGFHCANNIPQLLKAEMQVGMRHEDLPMTLSKHMMIYVQQFHPFRSSVEWCNGEWSNSHAVVCCLQLMLPLSVCGSTHDLPR
eukprot:GHVU01182638.1.p2 GENE.GHVU01182638.1~~GHVU01182638.1.p2  ORF type:complete len:117 (+),score=13.69 GHVU01182638.1:364-714(+)